MRYFFRVEYDGTPYAGWQRQPNTLSVQEQLEDTLSLVLQAPIKVIGAGRTDAGVHAAGQGAHFDIPFEIDIKKCIYSVNSLMPPSIAIFNLQKVDNSFHARYSATKRRYQYFISERKRPLYFKRTWTLFHKINWNLVKNNINQLIGTHDFSSFCASGSETNNMNCTVILAELACRDGFTIFTIESNRFIYKMVRALTGTLIDIGRGQIHSSISELLAQKNRNLSGQTAPPSGLVLDYVTYAGDIL